MGAAYENSAVSRVTPEHIDVIVPEVQCPHGCDGQCSLTLCGLCQGLGWVSQDEADEYLHRKAKQSLTLETLRVPFRVRT